MMISKPKRVGAIVALVALILLAWVWPAKAATELPSYQTDQVLQKGMILVLNLTDSSKVEAASEVTIDRLLGVAAEVSKAADSSSGEQQTVKVASSGSYTVLVSDQNGPLNGGDYVTISSIAGVGMKADASQAITLGRALDKFDGQSGVITKSQINLPDGNTRTVNLGYITVDIVIQLNPLLGQEPANNLPESLKKIGTNIVQKPVSTTRVYMALLVFLIATIITVTVIYSGVKTAMVAIGRNPLVKKSIVGQLTRVVATALAVFISGLIGVYLLLKL